MKPDETWLGIGVKAGGRIRQLTDAGRGPDHGALERPGPLQDAEVVLRISQWHCADDRRRSSPLRSAPWLSLHESGTS